MAGLSIHVAVDKGEDARRAARFIRNLGEDPRPLLEIAGGILEESTRERFRASRGPGGIPWPPSGRQRAAAIPRARARGANRMGPRPGGRTLVDTGGLESSITHIADSSRVEVGIIAKTPSAKFAAVHQFGKTIVPKRAPFLVFTAPDGHKIFASSVTIPARPFLGVDDADRADLGEAWMGYLRSRLG